MTPCKLINAKVGHIVKKRVSEIAKFIKKYCVGVSLGPQSITVNTPMFAKIPIKDIRDHTIVNISKSDWLNIAGFVSS